MSLPVIHLKPEYPSNVFRLYHAKHLEEIVYVPVDDAGWEQYENPGLTI